MSIITSENGYVGGMMVLPLLLLISVLCLFLLIAGIFNFILGNKSLGLCLLSMVFSLPASFILFCLIAKYFEIGAYRQDPMIPFPVAANIAILKDVTG